MKRPLRRVYFTYGPDELRNNEQTKAIVAISKYFDEVAFAVPSRFEVFDIAEHAVFDAIVRAKGEGLSVALLRKAWPSRQETMQKEWHDSFDRFTHPSIMEDECYWAAMIAHAKAEAIAYDVLGGGYFEPHTAGLTKFKAAHMTLRKRTRIRTAIDSAQQVAGKLDLMHPYGSMHPWRYMYAFSDVAKQVLGSGTYKRKRGKFHDKSNPPLESKRIAVNPGFWAVASTTPQTTLWTPDAIREWEDKGWARYLEDYPDATGYWVYWDGKVGPLASMFARLK